MPACSLGLFEIRNSLYTMKWLYWMMHILQLNFFEFHMPLVLYVVQFTSLATVITDGRYTRGIRIPVGLPKPI